MNQCNKISKGTMEKNTKEPESKKFLHHHIIEKNFENFLKSKMSNSQLYTSYYLLCDSQEELLSAVNQFLTIKGLTNKEEIKQNMKKQAFLEESKIFDPKKYFGFGGENFTMKLAINSGVRDLEYYKLFQTEPQNQQKQTNLDKCVSNDFFNEVVSMKSEDVSQSKASFNFRISSEESQTPCFVKSSTKSKYQKIMDDSFVKYKAGNMAQKSDLSIENLLQKIEEKLENESAITHERGLNLICMIDEIRKSIDKKMKIQPAKQLKKSKTETELNQLMFREQQLLESYYVNADDVYTDKHKFNTTDTVDCFSIIIGK